jgi:hypothetical protein
LISDDCVIEIGRKGLFTNNPDKYKAYISRIDSKNNVTYLDELIKDFTVIHFDDLSCLFGKRDD